MLQSLSIQNIVLIDRLDIDFAKGLHALTGETGAGKSILLDSLSLVLGARADAGLIRKDQKKAQVSARFELPSSHGVFEIINNFDLDLDEDETSEGQLILRRVLQSDGRSKAFVNDQPVSLSVFKTLAPYLVEIHGQHDNRGLLDPGTHMDYLDAFMAGGDPTELESVWKGWQEAAQEYEELQKSINADLEHEEYLRACLQEIDELEPRPGEDEELCDIRERLRFHEQIVTAYQQAHELLSEAENSGAQAARLLDKNSDKGGSEMSGIVEEIDGGCENMRSAISRIHSAMEDMADQDHSLESIDDRLFSLRAMARKHHCQIDELAEKRDKIAKDLDLIENRDSRLQDLENKAEAAREAYLERARKLHEKRLEAGRDLDHEVQKELAPLKLEKARFLTLIEEMPESRWGARGIDKVRFIVATNPGTDPGPLDKVASGGEMARIMLAIKVVLADAGRSKALTEQAPALIFDEVDSGVGGSTAHAVGERLAKLGQDRQILVVTHSPQVAARADHHMIIAKEPLSSGNEMVTRVKALDEEQERREEIARMLAGAEISEEARAAASKLLSAA